MALPTDLLREFATRYIWWHDEHPPSDDRIIAQVMNMGTYDDILRLEAVCNPSELQQLMLRAQPGWISARSWDFWRGRLRARGIDGQIPEKPPRRSFYDVS